ncbi:MAG: signal peptidase I [Oscillospiraceae bacterium]|jgi:signal peptidase I|nr:signal peptidase I [Oscillospiraceae bacterium]
MDDKEFRFMHTVDRPTVEQLRREIERLDAAERLTAAPEEDEEEQEETGRRGKASRRQMLQEKKTDRRRKRDEDEDDEDEDEDDEEDEDEDEDDEDDEEDEEPRRKKKKPARTVLKVFLILLLTVLVLAIGASVYMVMQYGYVVYGTSMAPSLVEGDLVLAIPKSLPVTGDLVSFNNGDRVLIKRAIGCPGDEISVSEDGRVTLNGIELNESYALFTEGDAGDVSYPLTVPEHFYFVMGDNRANSVDSRYSVLGMVSEQDINGRIFLRLWPMRRLQVFDPNYMNGFLNIFRK